MFASEFRSADEAALVAEIQACTRAEAVTAARRFAAIGELAARADATRARRAPVRPGGPAADDPDDDAD